MNVTTDSFSDGGLYLDPERAIAHACALAKDGADAVDLGPASSHPDASPVSPETEIERLAPVVAALAERGIPVSVDSYRPETQAWALARGVAWLNDIRGFPDASLYPALARSDCRLVVMHSIQRGPATRQAASPDAVLAGMREFFAERVAALTRAGVARERLVLDPGMGFFLGDAPEPSLAALRALPELRERYGCELLVCVSRKSFLGALTGRSPEERGAATLAAELYAAGRGVDWIRTHDVRALADALAVGRALERW